jgi:outer membrane lipoprotein SlyB
MSGTLINLIIQLIGGAIGGNAVGGVAKNVTIGPAGNTIAGAIGGVAGGSILTALIPMLSGGAQGVWILRRWLGNLSAEGYRAES